MRRLCTICARGGSKGVPGKNVRLLAGKPLIAHSIAQAHASGLFERVAVSSDNAPILDAARAAGADDLIERPAELATDTAAKVPVIRHAQEAIEARHGRYDTFVDLDATSPLRIPADIRAAVELLESRRVSSVITGAPSHRSPYFNLVEERGRRNYRTGQDIGDGCHAPAGRAQDVRHERVDLRVACGHVSSGTADLLC